MNAGRLHGAWGLVPAKALTASKSRLAPALSGGERRELVRAMLTDVLSALASARALDGVAMVTGDEELRELGGRYGALGFDEPVPGGLNAALAFAARQLAERGVARMMVVPGDLPLVSAHEIDRVLAEAAEVPVAVVPDRHGSGTNSLVCAPPEAIPPSFGPDSFRRHLEEARARSLQVRAIAAPELAFDVDGPQDLAALEREAPAPRTRAWLGARHIHASAAER